MTESSRVPMPSLLLMGAHRWGARAHVSQSRGGPNKPGIYTQVLRQNPNCFQRRSVFLSLPPTRDGAATLSVHVPVASDVPEEDVRPVYTQLTAQTCSAPPQQQLRISPCAQ